MDRLLADEYSNLSNASWKTDPSVNSNTSTSTTSENSTRLYHSSSARLMKFIQGLHDKSESAPPPENARKPKSNISLLLETRPLPQVTESDLAREIAPELPSYLKKKTDTHNQQDDSFLLKTKLNSNSTVKDSGARVRLTSSSSSQPDTVSYRKDIMMSNNLHGSSTSSLNNRNYNTFPTKNISHKCPLSEITTIENINPSNFYSSNDPNNIFRKKKKCYLNSNNNNNNNRKENLNNNTFNSSTNKIPNIFQGINLIHNSKFDSHITQMTNIQQSHQQEQQRHKHKKISQHPYNLDSPNLQSIPRNGSLSQPSNPAPISSISVLPEKPMNTSYNMNNNIDSFMNHCQSNDRNKLTAHNESVTTSMITDNYVMPESNSDVSLRDMCFTFNGRVSSLTCTPDGAYVIVGLYSGQVLDVHL